MAKELDPAAEAAHKAATREVAYDAFLELRMTLDPKFDFKNLGYDSSEHARLTIVMMTDKQIKKMCSEHLRKYG